MIAKSDAIAILKRRIDEISTIRDKGRSPEFNKWRRDTQIAIENIFGSTTRHLKDFNGIDYSPGFWSSFTPDSEFQEAYFDGLDDAEHILSSMIDEIEVYYGTRLWLNQSTLGFNMLRGFANAFTWSSVSSGPVMLTVKRSASKTNMMFRTCFTAYFSWNSMTYVRRNAHRATRVGVRVFTSCSRMSQSLSR